MVEVATPDEERELCAPIEILERENLHCQVRDLIACWQAIHPPLGLPGRQHLDPFDIPTPLPNVRLIGTGVARAFDRDSTGEYLDETHPHSRDGQVRIYMHDVIRTRMPAWRVGRPTLWQLQDYLRLERIYLPLASDGEDIDMILALTIFINRFGLEF